MKRHQRFIEFYDVRNAAKALAEMNGKEIHGKQIVIEFSRPGGLSKKNSKFSASTSTTRLNFVNNFSLRPSRMIMPQAPPPPPPPTLPMTTNCQSSSERIPSYYSKGNPKGGNCEKRNSSSIQNSMASLRVNDGKTNTASAAAEGKLSNSKKNGKKSGNHGVINTTGISKQFQHLNLQQQHQQQTNKGNKPWKGSSRQSKEYDPRFLINEDAITESNCRDSRTTVMIKNIPNKYRLIN